MLINEFLFWVGASYEFFTTSHIILLQFYDYSEIIHIIETFAKNTHTQPEAPQTCCKLWILPAWCKLSKNQACCKLIFADLLLKQLASDLWIKRLDNQLPADLLSSSRSKRCERILTSAWWQQGNNSRLAATYARVWLCSCLSIAGCDFTFFVQTEIKST